MNDRGSLEVEWQFEAPDLDVVLRWLRAQPPHAALTLDDRGAKEQHDTYFDGGAWQVFHAGYSLRVRDRGDARETTLKALPPAEGDRSAPVSRAEHTEPGDLAAVVMSDGPVGSRLRLMLGTATAAPLFEVHTRRHAWNVRAGSVVLAEIAIDDTTVRDPAGASSTLRRVEVEEVAAGGLPALTAFLGAMQAECGLTPAAESKFASGLRVTDRRPGPPDLGPTTIAEDDRAVDRAYAVLRRRTGDFLVRESGTALGEDIEQLHDMRVATRRLRAALRVFDQVVPSTLLDTREELRWCAERLGAVRDLDVQLEHLASLRAGVAWAEATAIAPLVAQFQRQHAEARTELIEALRSDRYARLAGVMKTLLMAGPAPDAPDIGSREEARRVIRRRYRRFRDDAKRLRADSPHAEYHALRILGKRLRYSLELFVDLYGRPGTRALTALRELQDLLGELQDLATTDERLRDLVQTHAAELPPDTLVMIGRLMERHQDRSREIVRGFARSRSAVLREFERLERLLRRPADPPPVEPDAPADDAPREAPLPPAIVPASRAIVRIAMPKRAAPPQLATLRAVVRFLIRRR